MSLEARFSRSDMGDVEGGGEAEERGKGEGQVANGNLSKGGPSRGGEE